MNAGQDGTLNFVVWRQEIIDERMRGTNLMSQIQFLPAFWELAEYVQLQDVFCILRDTSDSLERGAQFFLQENTNDPEQLSLFAEAIRTSLGEVQTSLNSVTDVLRQKHHVIVS